MVVVFDADHAGRRAATGAYDLLRDGFEDSMAVVLPSGHDPSSFALEHGRPSLAQALDLCAVPIPDLVTGAVLERFTRNLQFIEGKFNALDAVAPVVASLPASQVGRQVARVAERIGLTYAEVTSAVVDACAPEPRRLLCHSTLDHLPRMRRGSPLSTCPAHVKPR